MRIKVPAALTESHVKHDGEKGRAWSAGLPALAERYLEEWGLRLDEGPPMHGVVSLVLPVVREDGTRAALKLQPGMQGTVMVKTGERTLLVYLAQPLLRRFTGALTES